MTISEQEKKEAKKRLEESADEAKKIGGICCFVAGAIVFIITLVIFGVDNMPLCVFLSALAIIFAYLIGFKIATSISAKKRQKYLTEQQVEAERKLISEEKDRQVRLQRELEKDKALHPEKYQKPSSGTGDVVKGAAAGWIIGGPVGGVIGAIAGKEKADSKRANK